MPDIQQVSKDGTQTTVHVPEVVPNTEAPCQAVITSQIMICQPMSDGSWRIVTSFQDNYNIVLDASLPEDARREIISHIKEFKQKWTEKDKILSLDSLLSIEKPSQ